MIITGLLITLIGLGGLAYCILKAFQAKKLGLKGEELTAYLQKLIPINMIALFGSVIGLGLVTVGLIF